ncbi:MAG: hypothetical protein M0P69_14840 [Bacteroidales bacterium]|nr:hypothetical protein [Bacteroidales bacterium]
MRRATEEEQKYYCSEMIHEIAGSYSGLLVIYGGGRDMWQERAAVEMLGIGYDTMAVNVAGMFIPDLTHLYSLHYKNISYISNWRKVEYGSRAKHICHSTKEINGVDYVWRLPSQASTSGLMAIILGHLLGYDKFILCGVPMDGTGYFYKPSVNSTFSDRCREMEIQNLKNKGLDVRSMSGRTADIFGKPTLEWIKQEKIYA